eukprot:GFUD01008894.1.p1 GENE.GFUD01008894.1~~GFUD01008894.1.p1  ORF type:complete len:199 (-),score=55.46 GFUD01008894.1:165-713(-)
MARWTTVPIARDMFDREMDMEFGRPMRVFDQHFGLGLNDEDIIPSSYSPYYSRGRRLYTRQQSGVAEMKCENAKWQISIDIQHFSPKELAIRTVDTVLWVEGKHEEKEDEHGCVSRQFTRKYEIPTDYQPESVISAISKDGILTVTATKKPLEPLKPKERSIPILTVNRDEEANMAEKDIKD